MPLRLAALCCKVGTEMEASSIKTVLAECGEGCLVVGVAVAKDDGKCFLLYHFNHAALILSQSTSFDHQIYNYFLE